MSGLFSADGTSQTVEYDRLGRRLSHTDPSTGTTTRGYNAFGELVEETDGNGDLTEYLYDVLGRIRQLISPDGGKGAMDGRDQECAAQLSPETPESVELAP